MQEVGWSTYENAIQGISRIVSIPLPENSPTIPSTDKIMEYIDLNWKGNGYMYSPTRLVCWRMYDNECHMIDISLNDTFVSNSMVLKFPGVLARNGISFFSNEEKQEISICAVTVSNTLHRLYFEWIPSKSIFHQSCIKQFHDTMTSIPYDVILSAVSWFNDTTVAMGFSNGRVAICANGTTNLTYMEDGMSNIPFFTKSKQEYVSILSVATHEAIVAAISTNGNLRLWSHDTCRYSTNILNKVCSYLQSVAELPDTSMEAIQNATLKFMPAYPSSDFRLCIDFSPMIDGIWVCRWNSDTLHLLRPFFLPLEYSHFTCVDFTTNKDVMLSVWESHGGIGFENTQLICCHEKPGIDATESAYVIGDLVQPWTFYPRVDSFPLAIIEKAYRDLSIECSLDSFREYQLVKEMHPVDETELYNLCCAEWKRSNAPIGVVSTTRGSFFPSFSMILRKSSMSIIVPNEIAVQNNKISVVKDMIATLTGDSKEIVYILSEIKTFPPCDTIEQYIFNTLPEKSLKADELIQLIYQSIREKSISSKEYSMLMLKMVLFFTRDENEQKVRLQRLLEWVLPIDTVEDDMMNTNSNRSKWFSPLYQSKVMKSGMRHIVSGICGNMLKWIKKIAVLLAYVCEYQVFPAHTAFIKQSILPQMARALSEWGQLYYISVQRMTSSGEYVMESFYMRSIDAIQSRLANDTHELIYKYEAQRSLTIHDPYRLCCIYTSHLLSLDLEAFLKSTKQFQLYTIVQPKSPEGVLGLAAQLQSVEQFKKACQLYLQSSFILTDDIVESIKMNVTSGMEYDFYLFLSHVYIRNGPSEFLLLNLFKFGLELKLYRQVFRYLTLLPDSYQMDSVRRFVLHLIEHGEIDLLCHLPFQQDQVISILEWQAANSDVGSPKYYHILYAYYISKYSYVRAAGIMHVLENRLALENPKDLISREAALLACINALSLVSAQDQWIVRQDEYITMVQLQQQYALLAGQVKLNCSGTLQVDEVAILLVEKGYIDTAMMLAQTFDMQVEPLIIMITKKCISKKVSFQSLEQVLAQFPYHLVAIKCILQNDARMDIPLWLVQGVCDMSALLRLYVQYGRLNEACRVALRLIPKETDDLEGYKKLEWLPYTALDDLLDQCTQNSDPVLMNWCGQLQQQLKTYFLFLQRAHQSRMVTSIVQPIRQ